MRGVVLLSGGLDSATALAVAQDEGCECHALSVVYGQQHAVEVECAREVAAAVGVAHEVVTVPGLGYLARSALTCRDVAVPENRSRAEISQGVPPTYVPARNTVMLGLALAHAEVIGASAIYVGFNVLDASGYPDCRPEFVEAFQHLIDVASTVPVKLRAPLIGLSKADIIRLGTSLGVDYSRTSTCYQPSWLNSRPAACGRCDACQLRLAGFAEVGVQDPALYT